LADLEQLFPSNMKGRAVGSDAGAAAFGLRPQPEEKKIDWTPLEHDCGCVVDWGWLSRIIPPQVFIAWCNQLLGTDCPWHGGVNGTPTNAPENAQIEMVDQKNGFSFPARKATGESIELGKELTAQLRILHATIVGNSPTQLKEKVPPFYRARMEGQGQDPVNMWIEHQLTNIVLNRGGGLSVEAIETMLSQKAGS
jgi:hypothetical protein